MFLLFFYGLWRSPRLYILKQLFSEISLNSGPYSPRFQRIIVGYKIPDRHRTRLCATSARHRIETRRFADWTGLSNYDWCTPLGKSMVGTFSGVGRCYSVLTVLLTCSPQPEITAAPRLVPSFPRSVQPKNRRIF